MQLFPLHYQHDGLRESHLIDLMTVALSTKFDNRNDRRFYIWILGDNADADDDDNQRSSTSGFDDVTCFFELYSRHILIEALRRVFSKSLEK